MGEIRRESRRCSDNLQFDDLECRDLLNAGRARRPQGLTALNLGSVRLGARNRNSATGKRLQVGATSVGERTQQVYRLTFDQRGTS